MSDENNDKLMEQFIEKATPKLLEAMQDGLSKQIEEQIGGLKDNAAKLLDEVKDAQRERDTREKQHADELTQLKNLLGQNSKPADVKAALTPESVKLTRTQARDPQLYRRAKTLAEQAGTYVEIVADQ
ncbi:hypothetical protein [Ruegeria arenilitoris]|uniref:hypothetical protein n=1 Tax=Ruegeria arenilitoris TaxID=1173585 RepID=UPI00147E23E4|nr:hypothetical protein [Ruegeria arenilitoris]